MMVRSDAYHIRKHIHSSQLNIQREKATDRTDRTDRPTNLNKEHFDILLHFEMKKKSSSTTKIYHYNASMTLCQAFHRRCVFVPVYLFFGSLPCSDHVVRLLEKREFLLLLLLSYASVSLSLSLNMSMPLCYI